MTARATDASEIGQAISDLRAGEEQWALLGLRDRLELLAELAEAVDNHAAEWVEVAIQVKGLDPDSALVGEEWMSGPYALLTSIGALTASLAALEKGASPLDGFHLDTAPDDRTSVRVLPHDIFDRLLLHGFTADVWTQPGVGREELRASAGLSQRTPQATNGVGLVLGAGNIFSIAPLDTLYELFAHNRVVLLKLNPITDPLLHVLEKVFARLIDLGLVRIVTGGAQIGAAAIDHPGVDHVHITGSVQSHDAIVFGAGDSGRARQARGEVLLEKPITSELGGVSPTIVLPGRWSSRDLQYQAEHVVTQKLHNNGYNCIASQILILSDSWPQKDAFLAQLRRAFAAAPTRASYYPGSNDRVAEAVATHDNAQPIGDRVLLGKLSPAGDPAFREEYFGPALGVVELHGTGQEFLDRAVAFANAKLTGTLGANLIVHPRTLRHLGPVIDRAIADLRYGTIGINAWTGVGYTTARAPWGAFPGHTLQDAQSGIGVVHNGLLLDRVERTVVRGPFRPFPRSVVTGTMAISPRPPWFVTNRTAATTGRRLTRFAARPRWTKLLGIFSSALRG